MSVPNTNLAAEGGALMERVNPHVEPSPTPMMMLQAALDKGVSVEQMAQLLALQERWEANEARKAFVVALNAFKADPPEIFKSRQVDFSTQKGRTHYKHAGLDNASELIGAALARHGISHRWDVEQAEGIIRVRCILTHALGHSESVTMQAKPDDSGNKNSIQAVGSTVSYLQRYTLFTASGIAPKNVDDDGRGGVEVHEMDPRQQADFAAAIDALADMNSAEVLWAQIADACTKCGDIAAYDGLKSQMATKRKALKAAA